MNKLSIIINKSAMFSLLASWVWINCACAGEQRPNILFILTDNQAASLLGAYGNPDIRTPKLS